MDYGLGSCSMIAGGTPVADIDKCSTTTYAYIGSKMLIAFSSDFCLYLVRPASAWKAHLFQVE